MKLKWISTSIIFFICCYTRCYYLSYPSTVVFDESYYGLICELYSKQKFHFDKQPPLFKILLCTLLQNKLFSMESWHSLDHLFHVSSFFLRIIPAVFGVVFVVLVYKIMLLLKLSWFTAMISVVLLTFDNGLVVQSRLMAVDSFYQFLIMLCLYCALKRSSLSIILSHICLGLAVSTHWSTLSMVPVLFFLTFSQSWNVFVDDKLSLMLAIFQGFSYVVSFVVLPVLIYFFVTTLHIFLLPNSGPHDTLMSSAFQSTLKDGMKLNGSVVTYGSIVHLRTFGDIQPYGSCYLRSISKLYPVTYGDNRGSSAQQVVSCCHSANENSKFRVLHPLGSVENTQPVFNKDIILLQHVPSGRFLNTHDVAAPISRYKQEVSCYVDHNASFPTNFEWKVKILDDSSSDSPWLNLHSYVLLQHLDTEAFLTASGVLLPSWGKGCNEIVGEIPNHWNFHTSNWNSEIVSALGEIPNFFLQKRFTIWDKTLEYMEKSLYFNEKPTEDHRFASDWYDWPFASTSIAYWYDSRTNSQIHFTGNVVSWSGGLLLSVILFLYYLAIKTYCQIHIYTSNKMPISRARFYRLERVLVVFGSSWLSHLSFYIFTNQKPLFIYQYLLCVIFLHIIQACAIEEFCTNYNFVFCAITFLYLVFVVACFFHLCPITYGYANISIQALENMKYWQSWDLGLNK